MGVILMDDTKCGPLNNACSENTYQRNSLDEFLDERRLSNFHFLLPFLSGLGFSSSHLSNVKPTGNGKKLINRLNWQKRQVKLICFTIDQMNHFKSKIHLWNIIYPQDSLLSVMRMCIKHKSTFKFLSLSNDTNLKK